MYRVYYISDQMFAVVEGRVPISYAITIIPVTLVKIKAGVPLPKLVLHEFYIWWIQQWLDDVYSVGKIAKHVSSGQILGLLQNCSLLWSPD
jgi:hypothetical protein